uniref:protease modulator HflK n=1 Tax=Clostridium sp. NkU-1 TaxID=1095009 RepID=UPI000AA84D06
MKKRFGSQEDSSDQGPVNIEKVPKEKQKKVILKGIYLILGVVLAVFFFFNSFYTLTEDKVAVVCTFGKPASVTKTGPHFKIPLVQTVYKMSKEIKGMRIGYNENNESTVSESEMITKDFNFVNVDFYVEYQVVDPARAYIYRDNAVDILENLAQSYIRDTVGVYSVDEVITTGKAEIQAKVKQLLSERLEREDIGIGINNVTVQDSEPPTVEVSNAFKAVEDAKQSMDTKINEAKKYQSEQLPAANARADKAKKGCGSL